VWSRLTFIIIVISRTIILLVLAHPASYPLGTGALSQGVKWLGNEADHSPPSSAKVKNAWSYTSTPPYIFMAWCLVKYRIHLHGVVLCYAQGQLYLYLACFEIGNGKTKDSEVM
jgi:hypothetical protein